MPNLAAAGGDDCRSLGFIPALLSHFTQLVMYFLFPGDRLALCSIENNA